MKRYFLPVLLLGFMGCTDHGRVTLELRIAEDEPAPGLSEMAFRPTGELFYLHDEVLVNQADVDSAFVVGQEGRPAVKLILTAEGAREFGEMTEENRGRRCGIVLDGQLVSAPRIIAPIRSGQAMLVGDFTEEEARRIARELSRS